MYVLVELTLQWTQTLGVLKQIQLYSVLKRISIVEKYKVG